MEIRLRLKKIIIGTKFKTNFQKISRGISVIMIRVICLGLSYWYENCQLDVLQLEFDRSGARPCILFNCVVKFSIQVTASEIELEEDWRTHTVKKVGKRNSCGRVDEMI